MTWKLLTEEIIDQAIVAAKAGAVNGLTYDQGSWCGTACCVLGFARYIAGEPEVNSGPRPGEIVDTPRGRALSVLMRCGEPSVLLVMERVGADGLISYAPDTVWGDVTGLSGNVTGLRGNVTGLWGDVSGLSGDVSGHEASGKLKRTKR